ncbi:MAG TPA: S8 family serine peptidase, partial [Acidimicrobiia bacterium]|nr:S8 family serine peptidase [Acidimicrobiia bacterium]
DLDADIINLSLGGYAQPGPLADALDYAERAGVLVVTAAGNAGADIDGLSFVPADLPNPNLAAVAATDWDENLWADSNYGRETVDLAAPGVSIVTTTLTELGTYRTVTGTSFAAPHVAATAALLLSFDPEIGPPELIDHLGRYGTRLSALEDRTVYGSRIQSDRALVAAGIRDLSTSVFAEDVLWLAQERITRGCNPPVDDLFCPGRPVTRGEMAAFLQRALTLPTGSQSFADTTGSVFIHPISAIAAAGITHGCNPPQNDLYCPERPITRGEMAAMLQRALGLAAGSVDFADTTDSVFRRDISAVAAAGVTRGCNPPDNDRYCPDRIVSRGEMAAFLHRALG